MIRTDAFLLVVVFFGCCLCEDGGVRCPPQETILPCRCLIRSGEYQVWCSHSDLPRVLTALRTIGKTIFQPIDELILENNNLPSLSGRTFFPLRAVRLMLRYNGLERVSSSWLSGLEQTLMELYLVEPELKSLPEDSLGRLTTLEAITIQSNTLKRLPSFANLPKLNYVQIESSSLTELVPRYFANLPRLEKLHINGSPFLARLESDQFQDLPALRLINITNSGLNWIHPRALNHLPTLIELSLVGNKITDATMIGRALRDLPNLNSLRLDYNVVERIDETAFTDLASLRSISISHNRIVEIRGGGFYRLPALRLINLSHNMIRHVHPESFSVTNLGELHLMDNRLGHAGELRAILDGLPRLTSLDVSYNNLGIIPFGVLRGHATLERLNLDYNKIDIIERDGLIGMPALRELSLRNNTLSEDIRVPIWNLPNLKGLDLSGNFFRRIEPGLLTNLPSLRRIDLSWNRIDHVNPLGLLDTPALEYINISHNSLVTLHPATFRHLIGLYELDLGNNRLLQFVPGLPRSIEYLHLKANNIGNIPDLDLPTLRMLDISSNTLKHLKRDSFRTLALLKKLYLGNNFLHSLEDGAFDGLANIEVLDLQGNNLGQIPPRIFAELSEIRAINLRDNKLHAIKNQIFANTKRLKMLDISGNQLRDIHDILFENTRELEAINISHNHLINLPATINGLDKLAVLDLDDNRLGEMNPDLLNSLKSLSELRVSENFIRELKTAAFDNMEHLKILYLNNNELTDVQTNSFRALPALKHVKLNENKIKILPNFVFNNLPSLQILELQENLVQKISEDAFYLVPHLLMLNLSGNLIPDMNQAGLQNLQSLEMLDVSFNRLTEVESGALDKMEWLVELKMDNNAICGVRGVSFNRMPRLRVLSFRNNKMMSFPERAVQKLRGNLAVLDIDGNPLACTCSLLWLTAWLQESSSSGPKCLDGILLTEKRLSREECMQESRLLDPVAPGCESELLTVPNPFNPPRPYLPWMNLKNNSTAKTNQLPSPEESELFYDDYFDYPINDTERAGHHGGTATKSPHFVSGDTPTLYAATSKKNNTAYTPKPISGSPSTSGFTIFGVPLSSFNINNLWGKGRNDKGEGGGSIKANIITKPLKVNEVDTSLKTKELKSGNNRNAERKVSIANKSIRGTSSRGMFPPANLEIQTGGFTPILPGSGGFTPIANPIVRRPTIEVQIEKVDVKLLNASVIKENDVTTSSTTSYLTSKISSMGHPLPIPTSPLPTTTEIPSRNKIETSLFVQPPPPPPQNRINTTIVKGVKLKPEELEQIKNISEFLSTTVPTNTTRSEIEILEDGESFEDIFREIVENVSLPMNVNESRESIPITTEKLQEIVNDDTERLRNLTKPALLIPGGQQPQYRTAGRSTITKIPSPFLSSSSPLLSNLGESEGITPLPHNKRDEVTTVKSDIIDKSWYFASYNRSNLGTPPKGFHHENCGLKARFSVQLVIWSYVVIFYVC